MNELLLQAGLAVAGIILCVCLIVLVQKGRKRMRGGGFNILQDIQQIYDPGVKNVIDIQYEEHEEEHDSGSDK